MIKQSENSQNFTVITVSISEYTVQVDTDITDSTYSV